MTCYFYAINFGSLDMWRIFVKIIIIMTTNEELKNSIIKVTSFNANIGESELTKLIELTDKLTENNGCTIINIRNYCAKKYDFSKVADYRINIGGKFSNMVKKDIKTYNNVNLTEVEKFVDSHDYASFYTVNDLEVLKKGVRESLAQALNELLHPVGRAYTNNDITLNRILVFNCNTLELSIKGQKLGESVEVASTKALPASKPLTVAKNIIKEYCGEELNSIKTNMVQRFCVSRLTSVKMQGEEIVVND